MARNKKPMQVGEIEDFRKRYDNIAIMLDRNTNLFFANFYTEHFSAPTAKEVEDWAKEMFKREAELDWKAVIDVKFADLPDQYRQGQAEAGIEMYRYFLCRTPEGRFLRADWGTSEDGVLSTSRMWARGLDSEAKTVGLFERAQVAHLDHTLHEQWNEAKAIVLPYLPERELMHHYGTTHKRTAFLPYSPETWNGLCLLIMTIRTAGIKIYELITAADSADRLAKAGGSGFNLLSAGDDNESVE